MAFKSFREEHTVRAPVEFCNPSDSQRQVAGAEDVGGGRWNINCEFRDCRYLELFLLKMFYVIFVVYIYYAKTSEFMSNIKCKVIWKVFAWIFYIAEEKIYVYLYKFM